MSRASLMMLSAMACGWFTPALTHGGGSATLPLPLEDGRTRASLTWSHIQYETFSNNEIETAQVGHKGLESLETDTRTHFSLSRGFGPLTFSATQSWVRQDDIKHGETEDEAPETGFEGHSSGRGDTTLGLAWRMIQTGTHDMALQFGVKLPTGENDQKNRGGLKRQELAHQPGSGSTDVLYGLSMSPRRGHGLSASVLHVQTGNGSQNSRLGSRYEASVAWDHHLANNLDGLLGLTYVRQNRDNVAGSINENSGGEELTMTPGLSYIIANSLTLTLESPIDVWDHRRGNQIEPKFAIDLGMTLDF